MTYLTSLWFAIKEHKNPWGKLRLSINGRSTDGAAGDLAKSDIDWSYWIVKCSHAIAPQYHSYRYVIIKILKYMFLCINRYCETIWFVFRDSSFWGSSLSFSWHYFILITSHTTTPFTDNLISNHLLIYNLFLCNRFGEINK